MRLLKKLFGHKQPGNAYDYSFNAIQNKQPLPLRLYQGKVILIVNTASKCGFTPQYEALEKLYQEYKQKGLVIIGVPSNDFAHQEPGTNSEIAQFCQVRYGVSFPLTQKEHVRGPQAHPFYRWAYQTLGLGSAPRWNFHKILIDSKGNLDNYYYSFTQPLSPRLRKRIEDLLEARDYSAVAEKKS